jgi:hypothetical protein
MWNIPTTGEADSMNRDNFFIKVVKLTDRIKYTEFWKCCIHSSHNEQHVHVGFQVLTMMVMKNSVLLPASRWCRAWLILRPWRWRLHVPPKHRLTFNGLHGVISQKAKHIHNFQKAWTDENKLSAHSCRSVYSLYCLLPFEYVLESSIRILPGAWIHFYPFCVFLYRQWPCDRLSSVQGILQNIDVNVSKHGKL